MSCHQQPSSSAPAKYSVSSKKVGLGKVRGSYHGDETFPPCGAGQRGAAAAALLFPKPLEPLAAEAVLCGAKGSPPVVFPSLSGWPGRLGDQPSRARRLQLAFQNFPGGTGSSEGGPLVKHFSKPRRRLHSVTFLPLFLSWVLLLVEWNYGQRSC